MRRSLVGTGRGGGGGELFFFCFFLLRQSHFQHVVSVFVENPTDMLFESNALFCVYKYTYVGKSDMLYVIQFPIFLLWG